MAKTSFVAEVALRRNLLTFSSTVCIEKYYKLFFQENKKDSKKVWEGIRSTVVNTKH